VGQGKDIESEELPGMWHGISAEEGPGQTVQAEGVCAGMGASISRVAVGVPHRVDRLKAIGNGQVPQCAALAWEVLHENCSRKYTKT